MWRFIFSYAVLFTFTTVPSVLAANKHNCQAEEAGDQREACKAYNEGVDLAATGDFDAAAAEFERAYSLQKHPTFAFNVARSFEKGGNTPEAIKWFEKYLDDFPKAGDAAQVRKKVRAMRQLLEDKPRMVASSSTRLPAAGRDRVGQLLAKAGELMDDEEYQKALSVLGDVHGIIPNLPRMLYLSAVCYEKVGNLDEAVRLYRLYLAKEPRSTFAPQVRRSLAKIEPIVRSKPVIQQAELYRSKKNFRAAIPKYKQARRIVGSGKNFIIEFGLAQSYYKSGQLELAYQYAKYAASMDGTDKQEREAKELFDEIRTLYAAPTFIPSNAGPIYCKSKTGIINRGKKAKFLKVQARMKKGLKKTTMILIPPGDYVCNGEDFSLDGGDEDEIEIPPAPKQKPVVAAAPARAKAPARTQPPGLRVAPGKARLVEPLTPPWVKWVTGGLGIAAAGAGAYLLISAELEVQDANKRRFFPEEADRQADRFDKKRGWGYASLIGAGLLGGVSAWLFFTEKPTPTRTRKGRLHRRQSRFRAGVSPFGASLELSF